MLSGVSVVGGRIFAHYMKDVKSAIRLHALDGAALGEVALPGIEPRAAFTANPTTAKPFSVSRASTARRQSIATILQPGNSQSSAKRRPFDPNGYEVRQVFYPSKDGTKIPMFIAHKRGLDVRDGAPALLYGYGGFNVPLPPAFSVTRLQWMEMGGVLAVANLRRRRIRQGMA
ncbi:MAG: hypothetical protein R3C58_02870 [Parvularculaceae bacterium]